MTDVAGHARSARDIIQAELTDMRVELHAHAPDYKNVILQREQLRAKGESVADKSQIVHNANLCVKSSNVCGMLCARQHSKKGP